MWFRLYGVGCGVLGVGCRLMSVRGRVKGVGCKVLGAGCGVQGVGCRVFGLNLEALDDFGVAWRDVLRLEDEAGFAGAVESTPKRNRTHRARSRTHRATPCN